MVVTLELSLFWANSVSVFWMVGSLQFDWDYAAVQPHLSSRVSSSSLDYFFNFKIYAIFRSSHAWPWFNQSSSRTTTPPCLTPYLLMHSRLHQHRNHFPNFVIIGKILDLFYWIHKYYNNHCNQLSLIQMSLIQLSMQSTVTGIK